MTWQIHGWNSQQISFGMSKTILEALWSSDNNVKITLTTLIRSGQRGDIRMLVDHDVTSPCWVMCEPYEINHAIMYSFRARLMYYKSSAACMTSRDWQPLCNTQCAHSLHSVKVHSYLWHTERRITGVKNRMQLIPTTVHGLRAWYYNEIREERKNRFKWLSVL